VGESRHSLFQFVGKLQFDWTGKRAGESAENVKSPPRNRTEERIIYEIFLGINRIPLAYAIFIDLPSVCLGYPMRRAILFRESIQVELSFSLSNKVVHWTFLLLRELFAP
jgi:hypothetical protein